MVILLPGVALLVFVSSQTGFSHHSRYVIPALPFFFIWMSKVGKAISWKRPVFSTIVAVLLLWSVGSSLWVYPHSISYFNSLAAVLPTPKDAEYPKPPESPKDFSGRVKRLLDAGPLNGPRHLLNSNIDWGQDLFFLERWCLANPDVTEITVAVWGSFPLESTTIPSSGMPPPHVPQPGWHAVSVNYIYDRSGQYRFFCTSSQSRGRVIPFGFTILRRRTWIGLSERLDWIHEHEPAAMIGYAIFGFSGLRAILARREAILWKKTRKPENSKTAPLTRKKNSDRLGSVSSWISSSFGGTRRAYQM